MGRRITPVGPNVTAVGGKTLDILGELSVDFQINGVMLQQNVLVVRDMSQTMILGWDFFLAHKARVDAGRQLFVFDGREAPLLTREQVASAPTLIRARERVVIPARSEKVVVAKLENIDCILDGYDIVVDPANVFGNDEGSAVARTVTTATVGQCLVQVINVTDSDVC